MKIVCIGGGPAGLYFSLLMKKFDPKREVSVFERNPRDSTFGWGVVLSDQVLERLSAADRESAQQIRDTLAHWDDIEAHFRGRILRSSGHGFCGISRQRLLDILSERAARLGVELNYGRDVSDADFPDADLIVAADGIFSKTREKYAEFFKPDIEQRLCKFTWLGIEKVFPAFTFLFEETEFGWFQAHCYRFEENLSTFIVECPEDTWSRAGLDRMSKEQSITFCEKLFAKYLDGKPLLSKSAHLRGSSAWINFQRVSNQRWYHNNIVLMGDAAGTAHFSIGSGTRLAVEAAIFLARELNRGAPLSQACANYQEQHRLEVIKLQNSARNSAEWFEHVAEKSRLEPEQFYYSMLTRSQRVSHENLRIRDRSYLESFERWFAKRATSKEQSDACPPMFVPVRLRELELINRVAVSPMAMYSAVDGTPGDFHLVHLGALALGGAGLLFTEMTNVSPEARITPGCAGLYSKDNLEGYKRIVEFVHSRSAAKIALQLGHAGPKGSTRVAWEGMDLPLERGNWELLAPSGIPYGPQNQLPREMTAADMRKVTADFVAAAELGITAGFDMLELHCAHGYLLSAFLSPLTNRRSDQYGGSVENRTRFPLEVFSALRAVWPAHSPISVRISATDWFPGGNTIDDAVKIAALFKAAGADIIDVSAGQVTPLQKPVYGRMFQTPFSDRVRSEVGIMTMAVGNIFEADHVNSIIGAGRADLCLLARAHLADPHWTLRAAAELGYEAQWWPEQYRSAKRQLEVNLQRAKAQ